MPFAIDQEKLDSPDTKMLDVGKPPLKPIPHAAYPKMLFLHPKDKAKQHLTKIVQNDQERDAAISDGWRMTPHIPQVSSAVLPSDFEADVAEPAPERRGPGRPPRAVEQQV